MVVPFAHSADGGAASGTRSGSPDVTQVREPASHCLLSNPSLTHHISSPLFLKKGRNEAKTFCVKIKNTVKQKANPKQLFF